MSTASSVSTPSTWACEEFQTAALRIQPPVSAYRLWQRHLTPDDQERLGGDLESAYNRLGTAGMWAELRGVTPHRAVAHKLGFLLDADRDSLLRATGEFVEVEEAISAAIAAGNFVLVERPREAYWNGERIDIDWNQHGALWEFLWELGRHGKAGQPIDSFTFGETAHQDIVTKRKSRLTNIEEFPINLADFIENVGRGTQQLSLPPQRIQIFALIGIDTLAEWTP